MISQAEYWNDTAGLGWVEAQVQLDAQLGPCGELAMMAAAVEPGETVLDVGCGCGGTTLELAALVGPAGRVVGLDLSAPMLARARERIVAPNVELVLGDAATTPLPPGGFDVLFSRFGVMFFDDPVAALAHLRRALKAGGRAAFVVWQPLEVNPWVTVVAEAIAGLVELPSLGGPDEPGLFSMADGDRLRRTLSSAGYVDVELAGERLDMAIGGGLRADEAAAFSIDHGPMRRGLATAPDHVRAAAAERVAAALRAFDTAGGVHLGGAVWVVTATSRSSRPGSAGRRPGRSSGVGEGRQQADQRQRGAHDRRTAARIASPADPADGPGRADGEDRSARTDRQDGSGRPDRQDRPGREGREGRAEGQHGPRRGRGQSGADREPRQRGAP